MHYTIAAASAALLLAACGSDSVEVTASAAPAEVRFVAFGDSGNATPNQLAVGQAMGAVCASRGCELALMLGDNFYASGVSSVDDGQFQAKFETPYASLKVPVWVTLGNHDNSRGPGEGSDNAKGDFQVEYHYLAQRTSDKWRMPARYYSFKAGELAEFFSLDSNPLAALVPDPSPDFLAATYGPAQQQWLEGALKASKAPWKIAFAHHPYLSNGAHGNAGSYDGHPAGLPLTSTGTPWKQLLDATVCAQGVTLLISGHDHNLQHLQPADACGKTQFIVSGAGEGPNAFGDPARNPAFWQQDQRLGFFWVRLSATRMTVAGYLLDASNAPVVAYERSFDRS